MYTVQVSAKLLNFPDVCCCCGCAGTTSKYLASATRETGKKAKKSETHSWSFPICQHCSNWIKRQKESNPTLTLLIGLLFFGVCSLASGMSSLQGNNGSKRIIVGCSLLGLFLFMCQVWRRKQLYANSIKQNPNCQLSPVIYMSWNGTVHTFKFANDIFCERFRQVNAKKILD